MPSIAHPGSIRHAALANTTLGVAVCAIALLSVIGVANAAQAEIVGFDAATADADRAVIAQRMLHGFQFQRVQTLAARDGGALAGPALDPTGERWELIAPDDCSVTRPCGVLVWVQPWDDARAPRDWARVLDAARVIYVSAQRSGNDQPVLDRRVPLALLGLAGVQARFATDPRRTWIGGFSGGGRVASRLAIGYPDRFAGGVFVATSDGPGTSDAPLPAEPLLGALRAGRWWFTVGDSDPENASITRDALKHFQRVCALATTLESAPGGHRTLDARRLGHALRFLDASVPPEAAVQSHCEATARAAADAALDRVRALLVADDRAGARGALLTAHRDWGGLIAGDFAALLERSTPR